MHSYFLFGRYLSISERLVYVNEGCNNRQTTIFHFLQVCSEVHLVSLRSVRSSVLFLRYVAQF